MNRNNNILNYKTPSRLPQEGGFYSGDCPGAAAITIFLSLFSSLRGTAGFGGAEGREQRAWDEEQRAESRTQTGPAVCNRGLHNGWLNAASAGKENNEHRISLPGYLSGNVKSGRYIPVLLSVLRTGLFCRLAANPDGASSSVRVGTTDKPGTVSIEGRNIPVLRTFGFHWDSSATNITGALHLGFQAAGTAIGETAAAPRNIFRTAGHPSGKKVQSTEILKENKEYRISLPGLLTGNDECRMINDESGRNIQYPIFNNQYSTMNKQPLAGSQLKRSGNPGLSGKLSASGKRYKAAPLLPRGRFYTGDCPGAAAITMNYVLFSSPRISLTWDVEFSTPHSIPCGVENSASRSAQPGLPVANQQAFHQGSFVPLEKGDEIRFSESGGIDDKTPNPRVQEVSTTSPKIRKKGFNSERRYAYVLN